MSLDVTLYDNNSVELYTDNITHNLNKMATAVSLEFYQCLWRPEELFSDVEYIQAFLLTDHVKKGFDILTEDPILYRNYNPLNGWGKYENLVDFSLSYYRALLQYPNSRVSISR